MRLVPGIDQESGRGRPRLSYESAILLAALSVVVPMLGVVLLLVYSASAREHWIVLLALALVVSLVLALRLRARVVFPLYTLSNLLEALREGDYSLRGSRARRGDAIGEVVWEVNALSQTLREQRLRVEETMALLSKVVAEIDISVFAFDVNQHLRLINPAGARLLGLHPRDAEGRSAESLGLLDCLAVEGARTVRRSFPGGEGRFDVRRSRFREGGLPHELVVVTDLSRALREEERQAWQRLIRVLGHELNNSLAPIASMAHSGAELTRRGQHDKLPTVFAAIEERARHLDAFIRGYAQFAKLPAPRIDAVDWPGCVERLHAAARFVSQGELAHRPKFDAMQMEQALLNLLKNAHESGSPPDAVELVARELPNALRIEVLDRGPGMNDDVLSQALLPFYSTKRGGTGLGLALTREIVEAHNGHIALANREAGGLQVTITLPQ